MAKEKDKNMVWNLGLAVKTFHLQKLTPEEMPTLVEWLAANLTLSPSEEATLDELRVELANEWENWEEEALKMNFIALILKMVQYKGKTYRAFFDKQVSAVVEGHQLSTRPDMLVALRTEDLMETPYFCFHEYKPSKPDKDPRGQLILDMLIAQALNEYKTPIYGCYVIAKSWFFVVLEGKNYAISKEYDATETVELFKIVSILKQFKMILETRLLPQNT